MEYAIIFHKSIKKGVKLGKHHTFRWSSYRKIEFDDKLIEAINTVGKGFNANQMQWKQICDERNVTSEFLFDERQVQ